MRTLKRGSNQHRKRLTPFGYIKALGFVSFWIIIILYCFKVGMQHVVIPFAVRTFDPVVYAPTVEEAYAEPIASTSAAILPTPTPNPIENDIQQIFGDDAPKAFKLLSCENHSLNPNAVNTAGNYPAGSRDIGVFQINEFWQKVNAKFLFNPDINIRIAHQIYQDSGNSFRMWTCGRRLGI